MRSNPVLQGPNLDGDFPQGTLKSRIHVPGQKPCQSAATTCYMCSVLSPEQAKKINNSVAAMTASHNLPVSSTAKLPPGRSPGLGQIKPIHSRPTSLCSKFPLSSKWTTQSPSHVLSFSALLWHQVVKHIARLNGANFGDEGWVLGPLWGSGQDRSSVTVSIRMLTMAR